MPSTLFETLVHDVGKSLAVKMVAEKYISSYHLHRDIPKIKSLWFEATQRNHKNAIEPAKR